MYRRYNDNKIEPKNAQKKFEKNFDRKIFFGQKIFFRSKIFFSRFGFVILIAPPIHPRNEFSYRRPCKTRFLYDKGPTYNQALPPMESILKSSAYPAGATHGIPKSLNLPWI